MDWASELKLIKEEAKRKREAVAAAADDSQRRKYVRRSDMDAIGATPTLKEAGNDASEKPLTSPKLTLSPSSAPPGLKDGSAFEVGEADEPDESEMNLPESEIIRRLRSREEPIKLFGERLIDTFRRLRKLEVEAPLDMVRERQRNDFMEARNAVNQDMEKEDLGDGAGVERKKERRYVWDEVSAKVRDELGKGDPHRDQKILRQFIKCLLQMWADDLDGRTPDEKRSGEGTRASTIYRQTQQYIAPLLKHFKAKDTPRELIPLLVEIAKFMQEREYQKANDAYIRMSIGNAPWPTGVTNVGIHSRPGREKIFAQNIAHILNDENSRKYIQSLKRLMTYCQTRFPTDSSKSFEYKATDDQKVYPVRGTTA
eukprot:m.418172 g.418172  ORF g.418172 m.418172 type:complete len:370 (+) comp16834_c0_seq78:417-1526(+)